MPLHGGIPLDASPDSGDRAGGDAELARMLGDFAAERMAAGRTVPDDELATGHCDDIPDRPAPDPTAPI